MGSRGEGGRKMHKDERRNSWGVGGWGQEGSAGGCAQMLGILGDEYRKILW